MKKATDNMFSVFKLTAVMTVAALVAGCLSAKSPPTEPAVEAEPVAPVEEVEVVELPPPAVEPDPLKFWTVAVGDNLWNIAAEEEVYNVPEQWPLIYKANIEQIKDADLIYPGQVLDIPRDSSAAEVEAAVHHAKTRGAWAVGPIEASDRAYLKHPG